MECGKKLKNVHVLFTGAARIWVIRLTQDEELRTSWSSKQDPKAATAAAKAVDPRATAVPPRVDRFRELFVKEYLASTYQEIVLALLNSTP